MNAQPEDLQGDNVRSMADFLVRTLETVELIEAALHDTRDQIRARLRAFNVAQDPEMVERIRAAEARLRSGDLPPLDDSQLLERRLKELQHR